MTSAPGDKFTIRIDGDASGPVVAGHDNVVSHTQPAESTQTNTANEHGTVYTVMHGDLHLHHDDGDQPDQQ